MADDTPEISGYLYKRRGGLGKWSLNSWQLRLFTISKEGMLCYFENETPEMMYSESRARGKLDLKNNPFEFATDVPTEGSPTTYVMQISPFNETEKWKLCASSKEDQNKWAPFFEKYAQEHANNRAASNLSDYESDTGSRIRRAIPSRHGSFMVRPSSPTPKEKESRDDIAVNLSGSGSRNAASAASASANAATAQAVAKSSSPANNAAAVAPASSAAHPKAAVAPHSKGHKGAKKRLKTSSNKGIISSETIETYSAALAMNICIYFAAGSKLFVQMELLPWILLLNVIFIHSMNLRDRRTSKLESKVEDLKQSLEDALAASAASSEALVQRTSTDVLVGNPGAAAAIATAATDSSQGEFSSAVVKADAATDGKPAAGCTFVNSNLPPRQSPDHTWCKCDHRLFHVRIGPDYNRYKKKAPSSAPIYEPFAVDVFCTKLRIDHAAQKFSIPEEYTSVKTKHPHIPPVFVIQIQIPSEPPPSLFYSVEDGPGWAILMYFKISEDALKQLEDINTASPAVKLFASWCEKSFDDPAWRGRFKVICSCTNLDEMGLPQAITSYNAKPVLIRRTGTLFKGDGYIEKDIHVHKFQSIAKSSIHMITSRCGLMFMQIGFVIEGRDNDELPETLFACVAVNKPQESQGEFLFEDE